MLDNYRAATSIEEVISIVKKAQKSDDTFLWINDEGSRKSFMIADFNVNEEFFQFTFKIDRQAFEHIETMNSYYIKVDYDMSAFKVFIVSIDDNTVTCSLPDKILSLEKREKMRTKCKASNESLVSLKIENELMKDTYQEFEFRILDYSNGGIGIVLLEEQMRNFSKISGNVFLTKLKDHLLAERLRIDPIYFKKIKVNKKGVKKTFYRIGFMFDETLPKNVLSLFKATF